METVKCNSKEKAIKMLQNAKEFFQTHMDMSNDSTVIAFHLSLIDAVQEFIKSNFEK